MKPFNYNDLSDELRIGREVEFEYNKKQYSITNSSDGYWYLYCDTTKSELLKICEFDDKENLIKKVAQFKIEEVSIQEIFDYFKYNQDSLCIL